MSLRIIHNGWTWSSTKSKCLRVCASLQNSWFCCWQLRSIPLKAPKVYWWGKKNWVYELYLKLLSHYFTWITDCKRKNQSVNSRSLFLWHYTKFWMFFKPFLPLFNIFHSITPLQIYSAGLDCNHYNEMSPEPNSPLWSLPIAAWSCSVTVLDVYVSTVWLKFKQRISV